MVHIVLIFSFLIQYSFCFSQHTVIDSLLSILKTDSPDSNRLIQLNNISIEYKDLGIYDSAIYYANAALVLSNAIYKKSKDQKIKQSAKKSEASSYNTIGNIYSDQGNYPQALKNYFSSLRIRDSLNDKKGVGDSYNNIGIINDLKGDYPEALKNYFISLKTRESIGDNEGIASSYGNIGLVYSNQGNYPEALKNFLACLKIREATGDQESVADAYNNLGLIYDYQGNFSEALKNYNASLKIRESIGDREGIADSYNNIAIVYSYQNNYPEVLKNFLRCLKIYEELGNKAGIASTYGNIGMVYFKQKKYKEAEEYLLACKKLSKEIGYKDILKNAYSYLTKLDSATGNFKGAYENHKLYILYRDSIDNEETRKKTIQSQMTYDFEKKELATKAEQDKKDAVALADKKRQQIFFWFLAALAIAIGIIAVVIFRGLQQSKKAKRVIEIQRDEISEQKEIVEHQKLIVEEHQKEIVDSITYAKRIQYTLLANKQLLESNLPEHFVLFKPKDIVSGDFYWATEKSWQSTVNKEEKIKRFYIAACDSTGHGVPGAFMSLLNISFLNEAVNEKNILEPHEILNHVRKRLIENMDGGQDGMDAILLCIEKISLENELNSPLKREAGGIRITYAAANNSPAIIKNGNLISLDADKMPVGKGEKAAAFTLRTIEVEKGDTLYLYTDGYADQFGGPKGKKFKYKQLDELLVSISNLSANEQSEMLNQKFEEWKAWPDLDGKVRELEQVDDLLVIGIKV